MDTTPQHGRTVGVIGTGLAALFVTTWHFDDVPTVSVLQRLAESGDFRLMVSDAVYGTVSLRLENATWEQALDAVLRLKGLEQLVVDDTRLFSAGF